ncbi:hypothetical protein [Clostridium kluyveri]|uniref:hypothetical protein n=1 Tax=Clostridium kluyveri TaxID=1534 RepID=UPI000ACD4F0F|nr:hypothetical protein [Clostridium kluyveri]
MKKWNKNLVYNIKKVRGMKIREILKEKLNQDKKLNKDKPRRGEYLSFSDIEKLMRHECYRRVKGAVRRVR